MPTPQDATLASWKHFVCGGATGIVCTLCVFPLDTVKKWMQTLDRGAVVTTTATPSLSAAFDAPTFRRKPTLLRASKGGSSNGSSSSSSSSNSRRWGGAVAASQRSMRRACAAPPPAKTTTTAALSAAKTPAAALQQAAEERGGAQMAAHVTSRLRGGGLRGLYRGVSLKLSMNFMQGACFNLAFVVCKRAFERTGAFDW